MCVSVLLSTDNLYCFPMSQLFLSMQQFSSVVAAPALWTGLVSRNPPFSPPVVLSEQCTQPWHLRPFVLLFFKANKNMVDT